MRKIWIVLVALVAVSLFVVPFVWSSEQVAVSRNMDARLEAFISGERAEPGVLQHMAVERLRARLPGVMVRFDPQTGGTRTVSHPLQPLSESRPSQDPAQVALDFVGAHLDLLGLEDEDVGEREFTDEVFSQVTGTTHLYWRQILEGIPVYNGQLHVNVNRHGQVQSVNNAFVPNLRRAANSLRPRLDGGEAVASALRSLGVEASPVVVSVGAGPRQITRVAHEGISLEPIEAALMLLPVNAGNARLVWNFLVQTLDQQHAYDFNVDAISGKVWTRFDQVSDAEYRVWPQPDESPLHGSQTHTLVTDPQNNATNASPNGWHDTGSSSFTILRGNNVHSYHDRDGNNSPPSSQPSGGSSLVFDFSADLSLDPVSYIPAAVTNLFYWNNLIHDVQYQHGFDEVAGNFQVSNFQRGGEEGDDVRAEAQDNADGSSRCNANFFTPTDGSRPRMQMFVCDQVSPQPDGAFDNGVIVHEYGHGISIRQVGGPSSSSCLNNSQQPGEGWSDWLALVYTHEVGDAGTDARGLGSYLFGQGPNGPGIRDLPYSTSNSINNWTYEAISGASIPHGVGSRWAQAIWEVYWALVDKHGFDANLYTPGKVAGAAGNLRALTYVNEGLKNTACSPTFLDARDGMIQAATNLHGGEDVCTIWEAFAAFGLGIDASTGGSNSTSATNGFTVPPECAPCPPGSLDFDQLSFVGYSDQNISNKFSASGDTLALQENTWVRTVQTFDVTPSTVLEFRFGSPSQGEIHAIAFEEDDTLNNDPRHFQIWGTQNWTGTGNVGRISPQYLGSGRLESFSIPVGQTYTGTSMALVFANDDDASTDSSSRFRCVRVLDCGVQEDFEGSAFGWFNDVASDCATGTYVLGTPSQQSSNSIVTQVGGDHTSGSGDAIFTAFNTAVGTDDVDGGNCILGSPTWEVMVDSELSVWYFHGQRDTGGDASDFFRLEVTTDDGLTWSSIAANGDSTSRAEWKKVTKLIPADSDVRLRMQASDGPSLGDIIEAGIDDLRICRQP